MEFVELPNFSSSIASLALEELLRKLQLELLTNPEKGISFKALADFVKCEWRCPVKANPAQPGLSTPTFFQLRQSFSPSRQKENRPTSYPPDESRIASSMTLAYANPIN
jgi:hypothetical protein